MNIIRKDIDKCNAVISIEILKEDYSEKVENTLKDYRKKANIPGFRPGMAPSGLIKKMYGKSVLAEELNKIVSDSLSKYIKDNEINLLGEPLPNNTEQENLNLDEQETFEFKFDIALAPEFSVEFDKKDKIEYYEVEVSKEQEDKRIKAYQSQFGSSIQVAESDEESLLKGDISEVGGEGDFSVTKAAIMPKYIKDEQQKALFTGKKVEDKIVFNPVTALENPAEISSFLKIDKNKISDYNRDIQYVIKEISKHQPSELNQELFDKIAGKDAVKDENEFRAKIRENIEKSYVADSDYKFALDVKEYFLKKIEKIEFPVEFLKRWLQTANKDITQEVIDNEFEKMLEYLKWDLIKKQVIEKNSLIVDDKALNQTARQIAKMQLAHYGMYNTDDSFIEGFVEDMLKKEDTRHNIYDNALENKVIAAIKEQISLENKKVSLEDFNKLFENKQ
jgi:trigger factor